MARQAASHVVSKTERALLDVVRKHGSIARAAIASEVDLTQQSVHRLLEQLISRGLLKAGDPVITGRGQPSPRIALCATAAYGVGVSVGTDDVTVCLVDLSCSIVDTVRLNVDPGDRDATLLQVRATVDALLKKYKISRERVVGACFGIPGFFVSNGMHLNAVSPLRSWSLVDLKPILEKVLGLPSTIENQATTAAIGESLVGAGLWASDFYYIGIDYGFGGGAIIGGQPYFGTHGNAGEFIFLSGDELANRPALQFLLQALDDAGIKLNSIRELAEKFDPTWPPVTKWLHQVMPVVNRVVAVVAGMFDPEAIVFGGQLPKELCHMIVQRVSLSEYTSPPRYGVAGPRPKLVVSDSAESTPAFGAALVPLKRTFFC